MTRWYWAALSLLLLLIVPRPITAQQLAEARFSVETGKTHLVGEPVRLVLSALLPAGAILVQWPEFARQWPPFEVLETSDLRMTERPGGDLEIRQEIVVTLWYPGDYGTPATYITYQMPGMVPTDVAAEPGFLTVSSVLTGEVPELRAPKPQVSMPDWPSPLVTIGGIVGVSAMAVASLRWYRNKRSARLRPTLGTPLSAYETALAGLQSIAERTLPDAQVYIMVTEQLREYIHARFNVNTTDLTTTEVINSVVGRMPDAAQRELALLLEQSDLVKFARYRPGPRNAQLYIDLALRWVKVVEREQIQGSTGYKGTSDG